MFVDICTHNICICRYLYNDILELAIEVGSIKVIDTSPCYVLDNFHVI